MTHPLFYKLLSESFHVADFIVKECVTQSLFYKMLSKSFQVAERTQVAELINVEESFNFKKKID